MSDEIIFPGLIMSAGIPSKEALETLDRTTYEWEMRAARGECDWICASCCSYFPDGMPDTCPHNAKGCDEIIQRDKREAFKERK